ncbi:hypothetical protein E2562_003249 [Oryza meyeriana var. granulata]|uniref:Uncharacterized protein n=1 Tax=Oryza meyeriana var. granulata TaxID=110450 RepID=A0A6G1EUX9_9ORYZ|nr:hypothetical protein E2562_003249 [Oryza meyeriana var. granulata]
MQRQRLGRRREAKELGRGDDGDVLGGLTDGGSSNADPVSWGRQLSNPVSRRPGLTDPSLGRPVAIAPTAWRRAPSSSIC